MALNTNKLYILGGLEAGSWKYNREVEMERDNMSDLLNIFKNVLNNYSTAPTQSSETSNTNNDNSNNTTNNSLDITPEMISQLASNLKNQYSKNSSSDNINENITTNSNSHSNHNSPNNNSENNLNIDFDTILKIKNMMESFNQIDDNKSNLLYSLKPYLRESRQRKIDQYVNLFKLSGIAKMIKQEKGDLK